MTRAQKLQDEGRQPDLPPLAGGEHLVGYLLDAGPLSHGGMGPVPLSHLDIQAWQCNTGIELTAWEARTLRDLSREYVAQLQASAAPDEPAPYVHVDLQADRREAVSQRVASIFGGLAKRQAQRSNNRKPLQ